MPQPSSLTGLLNGSTADNLEPFNVDKNSATLVRTELSDGSEVFDVIVTFDDDSKVVFNMIDIDTSKALIELIQYSAVGASILD